MTDKRVQFLAIITIALLALNMRTAVGSFSPLVTYIQEEISLPIVTIGLLGLAAPLAFAVATSLANPPARRFGVEKTLIVTSMLIIAGHVLRALAWDSTALFAGSLMSLLGMGVGNILMPVLVRKYFAHRVGLVSTIYISLTAVSASAGSFLAVPLADLGGWRFSLGQWALFATLTLMPLFALRKNSVPELPETGTAKQKAIWRSPTAWAIFGTQGMTSIFGYVSFAWLPLLLLEHNSVSVSQAGALLSLFAILGLPAALLVPSLAVKYRRSHAPIIWFSSFMGMAGAMGILFASNSWLWFFVAALGLGPTMFPLALTLYNLRSRHRSTVLAVSAFGQGMSYTVTTVLVFLVGIMREVTGGWEFTLWLFFGVALLSALMGIQIAKNHFVDDELAS
ncbi:MAG: MFS transporter [Aquiluna sp.]|nr:MFS transporter [Aquiluna sp.]